MQIRPPQPRFRHKTMKQPFAIKESLRVGWRTMRTHSALVFQVVLTMFALQVAYEVVNKVLADSALGVVAAFVFTLLMIVAGVGSAIISLKLVRKEAAQYRDIIPSQKILMRSVVSGLLAALLVLLPLVVAVLVVVLVGVSSGIAPTFSEWARSPVQEHIFAAALFAVVVASALVCAGYIMLRYSLARFAVIDGARIVESLRTSAALVRGQVWRLLGFFAALALLNIAGALFFLVGLLITVPVSMLAYAHVYNQLQARVEKAR